MVRPSYLITIYSHDTYFIIQHHTVYAEYILDAPARAQTLFISTSLNGCVILGRVLDSWKAG